jgi:hypothetical protein
MEINTSSGSTPEASAGRTAIRALTGVAIGTLASFAAHAANCADAPVSGKTYSIVNEGSGLALDVLGYSKDDGVDIVQYQSNGYANQQWKATKIGDGSWSLRPVHSQKSMDIYGWQTADKTPVKQWGYGGTANQLFDLRAAGGGTLNIVSNYSGKLVTVGDKQALSKVYQDSDRKSANQRWFLNPVDGKCNTTARGDFGTFMGQTKVLVGGQMNDDTITYAPFDVRYRYIASLPVPDYAYLKACPGHGAGWWACWDYSRPPGTQIKGWGTEGKSATWQNVAHPRLTMFTYYVMYSAAGGEGSVQMAYINDAEKLKRYLTDWRFFLQTLGTDRVMVQVEPDFWGFVRGKSTDPRTIPAQVASANSTDCANQENNAAGLGRCMISMARKYAPNVAVGLHASPWTYMAPGDADAVGKFMLALGAGDGDFVTTDPSDRDAGWYKAKQNKDTFWTDETFNGYLAWSKRLAEVVGKSTVMWQVPLGNWQQNNTINHWQDNKVDYIFSNMEKVADAHIAAVLFGAGHWEQTSPESDGGRLLGWTQGYHKNGGVRLR